MSAGSPLRRFAVALLALGCAAALFRANVAAALVTRGDDLLRTGDLDGALRRYARAVSLDPRSPLGADRLAFHLLLRRRSGDAARAYAVADAALTATPSAAPLVADRAFAGLRLARWRGAEADFARAAEIAHDARYAHLAARMAQRAGDRGAALRHLRAALALDPRFAPSRALLATIGR